MLRSTLKKTVLNNVRAASSSNEPISQDFISNLLERIKVTTSQKAADKTKRFNNIKNNEKRSNEKKASTQNRNRSRNNNYNGNSNNIDERRPRRDTSKVSPRVTPTVNTNFIAKQQQVGKKIISELSDKDIAESLSAMDLTAEQPKQQQKQQPRRNTKFSSQSQRVRTPRRNNNGQRRVFNSDQAARKQHAANVNISQHQNVNVAQYVPTEVTPLSLLKYSPNIIASPKTASVQYALKIAAESGFPMNKPINYGLQIDKDTIINKSLIPDSTTYGDYESNAGLRLIKERYTRNIVIEQNKAAFDAIVKGRYSRLHPNTIDTFAKITKNEQKRKDLLKNSETVRLSLERGNLCGGDLVKKELIYKVCSGLAPIAELKK